MPRPRRENPAARWVVVAVVVLAALLAFAVRGLLSARVTQSRALALLQAGKPFEALEEADSRLSHQPDDPHLRNVAVQAASQDVDELLKTRDVAQVADWLEDQLKRRPYLRAALQPRLTQLQAAARARGAARDGAVQP
ncbi:MAG: hypothetical protein ACLPJH_12970 [Myxococcaceae bacterium]